MTTTAFGTPNLNLKVRQVVSEMSDLFRLSRVGDVNGCQTLFSTQQASPDDVNPIGGWTVLHFAVDHGSVGFCRVLIQQGADPNWEDGSGMGDIEEEIKSNPSLVEAVGTYGWTPLHCAVRQDDASHQGGSKHERNDPIGNTILHFAANESDLGTLTLLTRARMYRADVKVNNYDGSTARDVAVNRIRAPHGFVEALDRLIASILDADWSPLLSASVMSDQESFKSFEELVW
ncbi:MAG: hypothetical protein Q9188_006154 [Gyalolechia gomerana]